MGKPVEGLTRTFLWGGAWALAEACEELESETES